MFVFSTFFEALARIVDMVLYMYMWVIIARAVISWVNPDPYNPIVQFLYRITEPVLERYRRMIPTYNLGIDLSPILVILTIVFLQYFLVPVLMGMGRVLG